MGEYVPKHIPEQIRSASRARTAQGAAPHAARRGVVHARRQPAAMAELVAAVGFNHREGMTLHTIATATATGIVLWHTGCLAEMIVPYRDSS